MTDSNPSYGPNLVFVGGINWKATEDDLKSCFSKYGEVVEVKVIRDRHNNNQSKGYGFVLFKDTSAAEKVKKEGYISLLGKTMNVGDAYRGGTKGSRSGGSGNMSAAGSAYGPSNVGANVNMAPSAAVPPQMNSPYRFSNPYATPSYGHPGYYGPATYVPQTTSYNPYAAPPQQAYIYSQQPYQSYGYPTTGYSDQRGYFQYNPYAASSDVSAQQQSTNQQNLSSTGYSVNTQNTNGAQQQQQHQK